MIDHTAKETRITVPSEAPDGLAAQRSGQFGRCEGFTMVDLTDGEIGEVEVFVDAPRNRVGACCPC
jgi:predicted Fe-Mo cluster-binding NifX family protein